MPAQFGSDRVLLYDVAPWNDLGFGVPNFGNNIGTLSVPISNLVNEIGQIQLYVMTHVDAMRKQPPSINTVRRLGGMCNRIKNVLALRQKLDTDLRLEPGHGTPQPEVFLIHPVPYFSGVLVRNKWMREYNSLCMIGLTNMMQHSDNNLALTITQKFAQDTWQYFREIMIQLGSELLAIPMADLQNDTFVFTEAHYAAYKPSTVTVNIEAIDQPGPLFSLPTEDDLRPLLNGIPANLIFPMLKQYPVGPTVGLEGLSGAVIPPGSGAVGAGGDNKATGPVIAQPAV